VFAARVAVDPADEVTPPTVEITRFAVAVSLLAGIRVVP
jgi:hypothetical protein